MEYCYHCMEPIDKVCPSCGRKTADLHAEPHHLKPGTSLRGRYRVGSVLGEGGFGITYIGIDPVFERKVAIKEFYMAGYVLRDHTISDEVRTGGGTYGEIFENNRKKFLLEARNLAKFEDEAGIVRVRDFFEANNTAYIVMDFLDGMTLRDHVKRDGTLSGTQVVEILEPVFRALSHVHKAGLIHRDISPDNIMILKNSEVKLLDFGATRQMSEHGSKSLSVILKHGYAPYEQYQSKGKQGPWTDIYALCATIYWCITGIVPDGAMDRMIDDQLKPPVELNRDCSDSMNKALMKGLQIRPEDRWQSITELRNALRADAEQTVITPSHPETPKKRRKLPLILGTLAVLIAMGLTLVLGNVAVQNAIGDFYWKQNKYEQAVGWYQQAAELGGAEAQNNLGNCYFIGWGVEQDYTQAAEWYQKAAEQNHAEAQDSLGDCYYHKKGVERDYAQAVEWYRKAAEQGNAEAQYMLGRCYYNGYGIEEDYEQAIEWYRKAAEQSNAEAQYHLGQCYYLGVSVEQDLTQARYWNDLAKEQGYEPAFHVSY